MSKIPTFNAFMERQIGLLQASGSIRTSETYKTTLNRFNEFLEGREVTFVEITPGLISDFEDYLIARHNCRNTTSFYMRILRAVFNRAINKGWVRRRDPFVHVYTWVDKTRKRAVQVSVIQKLKAMDLSGEPKLEKARDMFLFSFYTRGMSFIDMAFLRSSDLHGKMLRYTRRKTGQTLNIKWEPGMQEIIDRYPANPNGFLLPILSDPDKDLRHQYKSSILQINQSLAELSKRLRLATPLTTYVARHSWASIAYNHNIPLPLISEGMGHESERTTKIYLASLSGTKIDRINKRIINMI